MRNTAGKVIYRNAAEIGEIIGGLDRNRDSGDDPATTRKIRAAVADVRNRAVVIRETVETGPEITGSDLAATIRDIRMAAENVARLSHTIRTVRVADRLDEDLFDELSEYATQSAGDLRAAEIIIGRRAAVIGGVELLPDRLRTEIGTNIGIIRVVAAELLADGLAAELRRQADTIVSVAGWVAAGVRTIPANDLLAAADEYRRLTELLRDDPEQAGVITAAVRLVRLLNPLISD